MHLKPVHRYILSISTGVLLSLPWIGFPGWIILIAWIPLLLIEQFFVDHKKHFGSVSFFGYSFLSSLIWNVLTCYWIAHASLPGALAIFFLNASFMSIVLWLGHLVRRKLASFSGYSFMVLLWISFEFLHTQWDLEWPWLHLGNAFANNPKLVQWYEFTGVLGGSLWALALNLVILQVIKPYFYVQRIRPYGSIPVLLLILLLPLTFSLYQYYNYQEKDDSNEILLIQPNIDPYSEEFDHQHEREKLDFLSEQIKLHATPSTRLIVAPETVFEQAGSWNKDKLDNQPLILALSTLIRQFPEAEFIFGASTMKVYVSSDIKTHTARESDGTYYDIFNSALYIPRTGQVQVYDKSRLVAGVEKMPFSKYLRFLENYILDLGGTSGSLGYQEESSVFKSKDSLTTAPIICFESVFGEYVSSYVKKGAQLLLVITNDGWWKDTPGYKQHLSYSRLRAIETRRSIARAANTGISALINQRGDILNQSEWWTKAVVSGTLNLNDKTTFYVKYGDYIGRIASFLSCLFLLLLLVKQFTNR